MRILFCLLRQQWSGQVRSGQVRSGQVKIRIPVSSGGIQRVAEVGEFNDVFIILERIIIEILGTMKTISVLYDLNAD